MEINTLIEGEAKGRVDPAFLEKVAGLVLIAENRQNKVEAGLLITGNDEIRKLNLNYRGIDQPTDVLSFAMNDEVDFGEDGDSRPFVAAPDGVEHLGEVIISYQRAVQQAHENNHPVTKEIAILVVHGMLHLLGYDHEDDAEACIMEEREEIILKELGELS